MTQLFLFINNLYYYVYYVYYVYYEITKIIVMNKMQIVDSTIHIVEIHFQYTLFTRLYQLKCKILKFDFKILRSAL